MNGAEPGPRSPGAVISRNGGSCSRGALSSPENPEQKERRGIRVLGTVQGVGFRPFVYRLAREHGLTGRVWNTGAGVEIEVEGDASRLDAFADRLRAEAPPSARIDGIEVREEEARGDLVFSVMPSGVSAGELQPVPPDLATCALCLAECLDPDARRFGYPFTNCTNCGPRFTIIEALPYDRARTTMGGFELCDDCLAEYRTPADRRFHAEPIACAACGPTLVFREGERTTTDGAIRAAVATLRAGRIVAIKGLGGFQLACAAGGETAVLRLRERKHREAKPFAIMVPDLASARAICDVSDAEASTLSGPRAPIVLLGLRDPPAHELGVASGVAPGLKTLGVMLPPTPLHHLLLRAFAGPLVMTSGNLTDEPIAGGNDEAMRRLGGIADAFLLHDREIASRYDDSVVRIDDGQVDVVRRARGYAPEPIRFPKVAPAPILAAGPQLKNTFCLVRGDRAFVSQHIGDLDDALTQAHYHDTLERYRRIFAIEPEMVAHDLHPDCTATRFACSLEGVTTVGVQHHHAHVVSCMAEHGVTEPVIGVAFDGSGYGADGAVWGGELLVADWRGFRRAAHLAYLPLPGGDAAAREPWRMALAALAHTFGEEGADIASSLLMRIPRGRAGPVFEMARRGVHAPPTSSAGRLFDAVAALIGVRDLNGYEGQAAVELETRVDPSEAFAYPLPLLISEEADPGASGDTAIWDSSALIRAVVGDLRRGADVGTIAARFHNSLSAAIVEGCRWLRETDGLDVVVLSGGCFQNRRLLTSSRTALGRAGFRVLGHHRVPCNDGGVSLGQAAVALATMNG